MLPSFQGIVFDEAHNLEEVATSFLGIKVSYVEINFLLNSLFNPATQRGLLSRVKGLEGKKRNLLEELVKDAKTANELLFLTLKGKLEGNSLKQGIKEEEFVTNDVVSP